MIWSFWFVTPGIKWAMSQLKIDVCLYDLNELNYDTQSPVFMHFITLQSLETFLENVHQLYN